MPDYFPKKAVPLCIATNSVWRFWFLHICTNTCYYLFCIHCSGYAYFCSQTYSIEWVYHSLFSQSPVDEHLGCCHSCAIANHTSINSFLFMSLHFLSVCLWDIVSEVRLLHQTVNVYVSLLDVAKFLFIGVLAFYIPMAVYESTYFLTASPVEYVVKLLNFCYPCR